jgi:hypothetical protein
VENEVSSFKKNCVSLLCTVVNAAAKVITAIAIITVAALFGPGLEGRLFPVVNNVKNIEITKDGDSIIVSFDGEKQRSCTVKELSVIADNGIQSVQGRVIEINPVSTIYLVTRPIGFQSFGQWRISPATDKFILVVRHECHLLWQTETVLINWPHDAPKAPK